MTGAGAGAVAAAAVAACSSCSRLRLSLLLTPGHEHHHILLCRHNLDFYGVRLPRSTDFDLGLGYIRMPSWTASDFGALASPDPVVAVCGGNARNVCLHVGDPSSEPHRNYGTQS